MRSRVQVLLVVMPLVVVGCGDRVACTALPRSAYNNANGGAWRGVRQLR